MVIYDAIAHVLIVPHFPRCFRFGRLSMSRDGDLGCHGRGDSSEAPFRLCSIKPSSASVRAQYEGGSGVVSLPYGFTRSARLQQCTKVLASPHPNPGPFLATRLFNSMIFINY